MITSAGRLSSTISQGSPRRSAIRERPITSPITEPSAMAITNATATRASVAPRLIASAPELASSTIASATACGSGSIRAPASCEPTYQAAINAASEMSRAPKSFTRGRAIEGAGRKLARRPDQLGAPDLRQHAIERARIRLLVAERPAHDTFAVARPIDRKRGRIADADARRQPLPFRLGAGQDVLGLPRRVEEAVHGRAVAHGPAALERVADDRNRSLGAERTHDVFHRDRALETLALELGAKVPERQRRVGLALQRLLREERRRTIDDGRLSLEVETGAS